MKFIICRLPLVAMVSFVFSACTTTQAPESKPIPSKPLSATSVSPPVLTGSNREQIAIARRFVHSWDAGGLVQIGFQQKMESEKLNGSPGMTELVQRVFADVKVEEFEDLVAQVYARHLDRATLQALVSFSESPLGNRYFRGAIAAALAKEKSHSNNELLKQFSADELTQILKFSQSDAFIAFGKALPTINQELGEAGRKLGETKMREYLKKH